MNFEQIEKECKNLAEKNSWIRNQIGKIMQEWKNATKTLGCAIKVETDVFDKHGNKYYLIPGNSEIKNEENKDFDRLYYFWQYTEMKILRNFVRKLPEYLRKAQEQIEEENRKNDAISALLEKFE